MVKIKTSLLTSFFIIIGLTIFLSAFLIIMYSNIESKYRTISETMILEYRITETFSKSANSYAALSKDITDKNQRVTYDSSNKTLDGIYKSLNSAIVFQQSIEIYTRIKNMTTSVINDCNGNLTSLAKGDFSQGTGVYDRTMRGKDYVEQNTASLVLKELQYSEALQAQLLLLRTITLISSFILILIIITGSSIYAIKYSTKLSNTLLKLSGTAESISKGDLDLGVSADLLGRKDEIGSLSNSFSIMIRQLKERINNESRAKTELEHSLSDANALQQVIKEERDRARGIVSSMGEGLLVIDKDLKLVLMNPAAERLLEVSGQQIIGRKIDGIVPNIIKGGQPLSLAERPVNRTLAGASMNITIEDNYSFKLISGKEFSVALATTPLRGEGGITGVVEVFRDITPEKQSRSAIEQQVVERTKELSDKNTALVAAKEEISRGWLQIQMEKARLLASVNSITLGFLMLDISGKTLIKNPAVEKATGIKSDYSNIDAIELVLGSAFSIKNKFHKCVEERAPIDVKDINFNNKYFRLFMAPIFSTDNTLSIIGVVILIQDETEAKVLDRSKDEFFSIASHELRTPLTAIRGNTSLLEQYFGDKIAEDPEMKEMIDDIHESSIRLINIVNDFLNVSRLEQGKMEYKIENFDLTQLINKKIEEVGILAQEKNMQIRFNNPTAVLPSAFADKDRVGEVILNLLSNSIKYSDKGTINVEASLLQGFLKVSVTDTGKGIAPEQQSLLFRKFQQAGKSLLTRDTSRSTGLGLYISRLMIEQMQGKIVLEKSVPGVGSTFSFEIPVAKGGEL